jgi:hypothetical protein
VVEGERELESVRCRLAARIDRASVVEQNVNPRGRG